MSRYRRRTNGRASAPLRDSPSGRDPYSVLEGLGVRRQLQFSSAGLEVEAFPAAPGAIAVAARSEEVPTTTASGASGAVRPQEEVTLWDYSGQQITRIEPGAGPTR